MKIGLLTFHDTTNFGSALQAYALWKVINDMCFDCEIIDYSCDSIVKRELPKKIRDIKSIKDLYRYVRYNPKTLIKYRSLHDFMVNNTKFSDRSYDRSSIHMTNKIYDKFLVGSDIVWGLDITGNDYTYFLDFVVDNSIKYAYASSFGTDEIKPEDKAGVTRYLEQFKSIAVREESGRRIVKELTGRDIKLVLDPTLLISKEQWYQLIPPSGRTEKYVLTYFTNDEVIERAKVMAKKRGISVYVINHGRKIEGVRNIKARGVTEFLSLIRDAEFVVTGSYHGMAYSINFNKQFMYFNRAHVSRMNSLSDILELQNQNMSLYTNPGDDFPVIDYDGVNRRLDHLRKDSIETLHHMLVEEIHT